MLRDGSHVLVRPVTAQDKSLFVAGFEHLSETSRYRRFLATKKELSAADLTFFTDIDHRSHEALGAIDPMTGQGVGVARYVSDPQDRDVAEAAVAIVDHYQGRGLGGVLLRRLTLRAHEQGIRHFSANLLVENRAMLALFQRLGDVRVTAREGTTVEIDVLLPVDAGEARHLNAALRVAATAPDAVCLASSPDGTGRASPPDRRKG